MEGWLVQRLASLQRRAEPKGGRVGDRMAAPYAEERRDGSLQHDGEEQEPQYGKGPRWKRTAKSPRGELHGATRMDSANFGDTELLPAAETDP